MSVKKEVKRTRVELDNLKYITIQEFKDKYSGKLDEIVLHKMLCDIETLVVSPLRDGHLEYDVTYYDGGGFVINTLGGFKRRRTDGVVHEYKLIYKGHLYFRHSGYNSDMTAERLVFALECYRRNLLPESFTGFDVNCKDLCGNIDNKYNVPYNLRPDNLELCIDEENTWHSKAMDIIWLKTGKLYSFSARDYNLRNLLGLNPTGVSLDIYLQNNGYARII